MGYGVWGNSAGLGAQSSGFRVQGSGQKVSSTYTSVIYHLFYSQYPFVHGEFL